MAGVRGGDGVHEVCLTNNDFQLSVLAYGQGL
jgi:hypothetical protein